MHRTAANGCLGLSAQLCDVSIMASSPGQTHACDDRSVAHEVQEGEVMTPTTSEEPQHRPESLVIPISMNIFTTPCTSCKELTFHDRS